jgi:hypothetical protein
MGACPPGISLIFETYYFYTGTPLIFTINCSDVIGFEIIKSLIIFMGEISSFTSSSNKTFNFEK